MPIVRLNEPILQWQDGDFVQGFALVSRREVRIDKKGREYVDLELADASGSLGAKIWPDSPAISARFGEKDFIAFKGTVRLYRDRLQMTIDHCRPAHDDDRAQGFEPALLVPTTPEDVEDLKRRLRAIFPDALERSVLRRLAAEAESRFGADLAEHPAAKSIHHAYRGGLLEHVVTMAELAQKVCDQYPQLDRDLMLLGVYFHDLGKLRELGRLPRNDYTVEGQLVGHIAIGLGMLRECCDAIEDLPEELRLHLEHLVVSHHGQRGYGSPVEPSTPEAFALHLIDNLDSKLNQLRGLQLAGLEGLHYTRALGRTVYLDRPPGSAGDDA